MVSDLLYYQRRRAEETAAAANSSDAHVSAVHRELARRYNERLRVLESKTKFELSLNSAA